MTTIRCEYCGGEGEYHDDGCRAPRPARQEERIALCVPHAPWLPARVVSMARLRAALQPEAASLVGYRELTDRAPNPEWSGSMFRWLAEQDSDWSLVVQDDALVPENFWAALRAMLAALPRYAQIVGLHVCHPIAGALAREDVRIFTTSDALVGLAWAMRTEALREFVRWRARELEPGWEQPTMRPGDEPGRPSGPPSLTEDTMIGVWALATGRRVWHPIPAIVDHDTSLESTYGNDEHEHRRPQVTWADAARFAHAWEPSDLEAPGFWQGRFKRIAKRAPDGTEQGYARAHSMDPDVIACGARQPHLGRFYESTPELMRRWVSGVTARELSRAYADTGAAERRRLTYSLRAEAARRGGSTARERVLVCTPTRGGVSPEYAAGIVACSLQLFDVSVDDSFELLDAWLWTDDLVRVRSRFVRAFLETDATLLHFRDADVQAHPQCLHGMMRANKPFVAAPYRRRDDDPTVLPYAVKLYEGAQELDHSMCAVVDVVGLGHALIQRDLLERMVDHFDQTDMDRVDIDDVRREIGSLRGAREASLDTCDVLAAAVDELERWRMGRMGLRFVDRVQGRLHPTVALFGLYVDESGVLLGEDGAFCRRVQAMGEQVHMYLGAGSPVDHVGPQMFRGRIEDFGLRRAK